MPVTVCILRIYVEQDKTQSLDETYTVAVYSLEVKPVGHADAFNVGR